MSPGCAGAKPKDYEQRGTVEAAHEYDAWRLLRDSEEPLGVGDLLETEAGQLRIYKYVGFDAAQWVLPEPKDARGAPGRRARGRPAMPRPPASSGRKED